MKRRRYLYVSVKKIATEMYEYCRENGFGSGFSRGWGIKHFQLIVDNLKPDETVYSVFVGLHNYKSISKHDNNYAYAITDQRIIMAQHRLLGVNVQTVSIENVNDIKLSSKGIGGIGIGTVCIDTYKEEFNVGINVTEAPKVFDCVHKALDEIKGNAYGRVNPEQNTASSGSLTEQLKELKELMDLGIITESDFEAKKKQILGI